jgi:hypothetical protein
MEEQNSALWYTEMVHNGLAKWCIMACHNAPFWLALISVFFRMQ